MLSKEINIQYIGAATALLEIGGLRLLTDPAFDPRGDYPLGVYTLRKLQAPAATVDQLGKIDHVLLSHDHHLDNLDHLGQTLLSQVDTVFTTPSGAQRLNTGGIRPGEDSGPSGIHAVGLDNWASVTIPTKDGRVLRITGTPCRHGPVGGDRGPVTGFVLQLEGDASGAVYITGDTVWYEGVEEVAKRFDVGLVLLFMGAARLAIVGPDHITMTVEESIKAAKLFAKASIVPLHFEGWEHFSEGYDEILRQYRAAGLLHRLQWAPPYSPYPPIRRVVDNYFAAMEKAGGYSLSGPAEVIPDSMVDRSRSPMSDPSRAPSLSPSRSSTHDHAHPQDDDGYVFWKPIPSTVTDAEIKELETLFDHPLPASYRYFLKQRHWVEFYLDHNQLSFFPSFPGQLVAGTSDILNTYYADLLHRHYLPFANYGDRGVLGFDANAAAPDNEYPVVLFDHEDNYTQLRPYAANFVEVFAKNEAELNEGIAHGHTHH